MGERFPNNSHFGAVEKKEEQPQRPKKVINGTAKKIKKPLSQKMAETFVKGDVTDVGKHLVQDILIPSAIETLGDMGHNLVDGIIYGDDAPARSRSRSKRNRTERTSIDRGTGRSDRRNRQISHNKKSLSFDDVLVDTREEAKLVIAELREAIEDYDQARVSDLYYAVGWDNLIDYTTDQYGWYELDESVRPIQVRVDGEIKFTISLPKAEYLG